jgi:hypothetical protein
MLFELTKHNPPKFIFYPLSNNFNDTRAMKSKLRIVLFENFQFFRTAQIQILRNLIGQI